MCLDTGRDWDIRGVPAERCVSIQGESGQKRSSAGKCVSIQRESGQKRSSGRKMCLDTGRDWDIRGVPAERCVSIQGESGQKRSSAGKCVSIQRESRQKRSFSRKMCLDTGRIETEKILRQKDVSRYRGNRDRKGLPAERCVSIQAESRQKRSSGRKMCLDTGRIGTEKVFRQKDVSRYRGNRDRKGPPAERCVSIQGESRQKRSSRRKLCLDKGRIGTEKVFRQKVVSRYRGNRDRKGPPAERCVSIQGESGQKRSFSRKMCLDTERIETEKVLQQEDVSRYGENRDRKGPPKKDVSQYRENQDRKGLHKKNLIIHMS
ncbi:hypothetical protein [Metabacillus sp. B2-18]|nr:hypothetical protein [Metabacillus sp. B2-18]UGB31571.1 hypothetical protein LPC09_03565 [Metabacillus sp. B2-18]